jgi:DNA-directed RNA polymerase specialized sigma24 family protein
MTSIVAHVDTVGAGRHGWRAASRWAVTEPALAGYESPAGVARAVRAATPQLQDRVVGALLRVGEGDEWAELTVLAVLAPRVAWAVRAWVAGGVSGSDVADLEADLVSECWTLIRDLMGGPVPPDRPGLTLVGRSRTTVRDRRDTARRRTARDVFVDAAAETGGPAAEGDNRSGIEVLADRIVDAHCAMRLTLGPARALYLTRVAGLSTAETAALLATDPGSVRALRSRATRQLLRTGLPGGGSEGWGVAA